MQSHCFQPSFPSNFPSGCSMLLPQVQPFGLDSVSPAQALWTNPSRTRSTSIPGHNLCLPFKARNFDALDLRFNRQTPPSAEKIPGSFLRVFQKKKHSLPPGGAHSLQESLSFTLCTFPDARCFTRPLAVPGPELPGNDTQLLFCALLSTPHAQIPSLLGTHIFYMYSFYIQQILPTQLSFSKYVTFAKHACIPCFTQSSWKPC